MRFEPTRTEYNPLPASIRTIIIDESSMVAGEPESINANSDLLFNQLMRACPHNPQIIFLGDIQQLPPVFGSAILGYKMLELPTVELTEVYRQALDSPIIRLAHRILSGKPIPAIEYPEWKVPNKLTIHNWKKKIKSDDALMTIAKFITTAYDTGNYNPDEDMILIPFNKACGTLELNKSIANHLARTKQLVTYEIIAGFNKYYFTVGDKVLYDKEEAVITKIESNPEFTGRKPQRESAHLDYWGYNSQYLLENPNDTRMTDEEVDKLLEQVNLDEDRVTQSSHIITVKLSVNDSEIKINSASVINSMLLAYALTVHKSQGSEWRKVFFVTHQSHATMIQRELMYTAVTRAREELYIICEDEAFTKGILNQRIKGNTLAEKAEYFKGKIGESNE
jgi:exodeoxyribonuclease V alpha subunit